MSLRRSGLCLLPALIGCWTLKPGDAVPDGGGADVVDVVTRDAADVVTADVVDAPSLFDVADVSDVVDASVTPDVTDVVMDVRDVPDVGMDVQDVPDVGMDVRDVPDVGMDVRDVTDVGMDVRDVPVVTDVPTDRGDVPVVIPPGLRLVYPPGLSTVTTNRPTLRWNADVSGLEVVICDDRECDRSPPYVAAVSGRSFTPTSSASLRPGVHFWSLRRRGEPVPLTPTWQFRVPAVSLIRPEGAFGVSCRDANGDGNWDVAVGAPGQPRSAAAGAIYVYQNLGRNDLTPVTLTAPSGNSLGTDLAWGDFNGDNRADLAAVSFDTTLYPFGAVSIFQATVSGFLPPQSLDCSNGCGPGEVFARRVAAGDLDGDGYEDLFVTGGGDPGRVRGWRGSGFGLGAAPTVTLTYPGASETMFGSSLAVAGDLDGDGYGDLAVGAPCDPGGTGVCEPSSEGRILIYFGGAGWGSSGPTPSVLRGAMHGRLGLSVAAAGDVNDDGYADLLVGGTEGVNVASSGVVHLFFGGPRSALMSPRMAEVTRGTPTGQSFMGSSAAMVDMDNDRQLDIVVGAVGPEMPSLDSRGAIAVWRGAPGSRFDTTAVVQVPPPYGGQIGYRMSAVGDLNGDGYGDLVVTAPALAGRESSPGAFYVWFSGSAGFPRERALEVVGPTGNAWLGRGLAP